MPTQRGLCSKSLWESTQKTGWKTSVCNVWWMSYMPIGLNTPFSRFPTISLDFPRFPSILLVSPIRTDWWTLHTALRDVWEQSILILIYSLNLLCALRSELNFSCKWSESGDLTDGELWLWTFAGLMWLKSCQRIIRFSSCQKCDIPKTERSFLTNSKRKEHLDWNPESRNQNAEC